MAAVARITIGQTDSTGKVMLHPVANDSLIFQASATNRITNNNFPANAAGTFHSISFAGTAFAVTGNAIRLTTSITSSGPHREIDAPIRFLGLAVHNINVHTNTELVLNKTVRGTGTLSKRDFGRLTLAGNNTFSGEFVADSGVTQLAHSNALGSPSGQTRVEFGGSIELAEFIGHGEEFPRFLAIPEPLVQEDADLGSVVALRNVSGPNLWTGSIRLGSGPNNDSTALPNRVGVEAQQGSFPDQLTISGVISDPVLFVDAGFRKVGEGRLILSGANTYRGTTAIEKGVVQIKNSSALGSAVGLTRVDTGAGLQPNTNIIVNGGVLQGTGTVGDVTVKIGGAIEAGDDGIGTPRDINLVHKTH
jgi:autotransporter-associated beta strand protein